MMLLWNSNEPRQQLNLLFLKHFQCKHMPSQIYLENAKVCHFMADDTLAFRNIQEQQDVL